MDKKIRSISKYVKYGIALLGAVFAVVQFLDFWGVYDFSGIGIKGLIILLGVSVLLIIVKVILDKINEANDDQLRIDELNSKITNRIGVLKSSEKPDKELMDSFHKISLIERVDILDYSTNDYLSYRIINGVNISKRNSPYLKYKESTDSKTSSEQLVIRAYDLKTGKELKIDFEEKIQKVYVHKFKIMFTTPIHKNEEFSIIYFMKIPNELGQLSDNEEMMSISLNRFENKIDKLKFGIYLNFIPSIVETFMRNEDGSAGLLDVKPDILEINEIEIDGRFRQYLDNVKIMSKISIEVDTPKKQTYVLHYRK